jgi:hypothetical protein
MGILDELLAGGQRQKEYGDFVKRYEQGAPSEGYSDQEVLKRYGEVSHAVSPDQYAQAAQGPEQAVAGRASGVRKDAAGSSRGAWRDAAATGSARTEGPRPSAHRSSREAGTAPGYAWRWRCAGSGASVGVKRDHRHLDVSDGQGSPRGHRGHGGQARHGSIPNGVAPRQGGCGI